MENSVKGGSNAKWFADIAAIVALFAVLYLGLAFMRPLASPDEGRYTEIPREMIADGDYVSPHLNGMAYFYKPPLFYWMQAASIKAFGINRVSARLPNSLMAVFGIVLTYCAARALYGRGEGIASALILGTSVFYFALGEIVTLDMAVSVFISGAMFSFIVALKKSGVWRGVLVLAFFAFCALAVMTKGLIGVVIPAAAIFFYALVSGVGRFFKSLKKSDALWVLAGIALFLAIAVPWHIMATLANPPFDGAEGLFSKNWEGQGFFWYYIVHEHILRYVDSSTSMRGQPWWFFFLLAPVGMIPWVAILPQSLRSAFEGGFRRVRERNPEVLFFLCWTLFVILFFSISRSKLVPYIISIYPAMAVITGVWAAKVWRSADSMRLAKTRIVLTFLAFLGIIVPIVLYFVLEHKGKIYEHGEFLAVCVSLSIAMLASFAALLYALVSDRRRMFMVAAFCSIYALLMFFNPLGKFLQRPSAEPLVRAVSASIKPSDEFVIAFEYNEFQDFPVWLGRLAYLTDTPPEEQKFGYMRARAENAHRFLDSPEKFAALVQKTRGDVYVAVKQGNLENFKKYSAFPLTEVARDRNFLLMKVVKK